MDLKILRLTFLLAAIFCANAPAGTITRDLGIQIGSYKTGKHNLITDVKGVRVGHVTLISGRNGKACRSMLRMKR